MEIFTQKVQKHLEDFEIFLDDGEVRDFISKYSKPETLVTPQEMAELVMFSTPKSMGGLELEMIM